jgi:hypothetical protein
MTFGDGVFTGNGMELLSRRSRVIFLALEWREDICHMACHLVALHSTGVSNNTTELLVTHTYLKRIIATILISDWCLFVPQINLMW